MLVKTKATILINVLLVLNFAQAMVTHYIHFNATNVLDGRDDLINNCDRECNYSEPHAVVHNGGNEVYSYTVICKSDDDRNPIEGCGEYYSCIKTCLQSNGDSRWLGLKTDFHAWTLSDGDEEIFSLLGSNIELFEQDPDWLDSDIDYTDQTTTESNDSPSPTIHAWPTPSNVSQNGPPKNMGYTDIIVQLFIYVKGYF